MIQKQKEFLICVDSDGCVFDNMELKHKECFCPATINVWELQSVSRYAREAAEFVNLYSETRGANRFPALLRTLRLLGERKEAVKRGYKPPELSSLERFIETTEYLSAYGLQLEIEKYPNDKILNRTLRWSQEVNENIAKIVRGVAPFSPVSSCLERLKEFADILIVSATPRENIVGEWKEAGIFKLVDAVAGQEDGPKKECIRKALEAGYARENCVMLGDAPGDLAAAESNGVMFYPIIPGREDESWEILRDKVSCDIRERRYGREMAEKYAEEFKSTLLKEVPWETVTK